MIFRNEFYFLSNMFPCRVGTYKCAESAFQAEKCRYASDKKRFEYLDGYAAKKLGGVIPMRDNWNEERVEAMYSVLNMKFRGNAELAEKLIATGEMELVEDNYWNDTFWGRCNGKGENNLGKLLMRIRGELGGNPGPVNGTPLENKKEEKQVKAKDLVFYFFETLSKLAQGKYTEDELQARREKGKAASIVQAINELITPDDVLGIDKATGEEVVIGHKPNRYRGTYSLYSQRCFDQGNTGDPTEYAGIKISFTTKEIGMQIDTKFGKINGYGKNGDRYSLGMGKTLIERLDDIGEALWSEWGDSIWEATHSTESMIERLRNVEDEQTWSYDDDYFYTEQKTWSRPTDSRNYSRLETNFERDVRGGIKYTDRDDDPQAGRPYNHAMFLRYREVIEDQMRLQKEIAEKEIRKQKYTITKPVHEKDKRWSNLTDEEKAAALAAFRAKKASDEDGK